MRTKARRLRTRRTPETDDELRRDGRRPRVRKLAVISTHRSGFRIGGAPHDVPPAHRPSIQPLTVVARLPAQT